MHSAQQPVSQAFHFKDVFKKRSLNLGGSDLFIGSQSSKIGREHELYRNLVSFLEKKKKALSSVKKTIIILAESLYPYNCLFKVFCHFQNFFLKICLYFLKGSRTQGGVPSKMMLFFGKIFLKNCSKKPNLPPKSDLQYENLNLKFFIVLIISS
ncbi:MAG: hypothetical protein CM15mP98_13350 [Paracoccaceae bacterium]|nr:MAG: hypothetical protein CM15mP98_13350 [Paracoccaceae bacterium]